MNGKLDIETDAIRAERLEVMIGTVGHLHALFAFDLGNLVVVMNAGAEGASMDPTLRADTLVYLHVIKDGAKRFISIGKEIRQDLETLSQLLGKEQISPSRKGLQ